VAEAYRRYAARLKTQWGGCDGRAIFGWVQLDLGGDGGDGAPSVCALFGLMMGVSSLRPNSGSLLTKALLPNTLRPIPRSIMVLPSGLIGLPVTCVGQLYASFRG